MQQKMKQQKRKLILRVSLMVCAAWLAASAAFVVGCIQWVKSDAMSAVKGQLSLMARQFSQWSAVTFPGDRYEWMLAVSEKEGQQAIFQQEIDYLNHKIADSNGLLAFQTGLHADSGAGWDLLAQAFVRRDRILNAMTPAQRQAITAYCESSDVPLVISRFLFSEDSSEVIPTELQAVRTDGDGHVAEVLHTYTLQPDLTTGSEYTGSMEDGEVLPTTFLLHEDEDIIAQFDRYTLYQNPGECEKRVGLFEYLMTAQTTAYGAVYPENAAANAMDVRWLERRPYILQYAERVNLWQRGKAVLLLGTGALLVFFLVFAVLLIVLLWRLMKSRMEQEQKRLALSNALAHDIKTPLFILSGYAENLRDNINSERRAEFAEKIMAQTAEVNALVCRMLDLGRLENSDIEPHLTQWDLAALTEELCGGFTAREIAFTRTGDNTVCADRALLRRAVENLLDNAVKYAPEGSVVRVDVTDKTLTVSNACEEMTEAQLTEMWQPYTRRDQSRRQDGSGLGLSIVRSVCQLHGFACDAKQANGDLSFTLRCQSA